MKEFSIRVPSWTSAWIGIVALAAGAILLWLGLVLAIVFAILGVFALALSRARRFWTRKRAARVPVIIDGHYTKSKE